MSADIEALRARIGAVQARANRLGAALQAAAAGEPVVVGAANAVPAGTSLSRSSATTSSAPVLTVVEPGTAPAGRVSSAGIAVTAQGGVVADATGVGLDVSADGAQLRLLPTEIDFTGDLRPALGQLAMDANGALYAPLGTEWYRIATDGGTTAFLQPPRRLFDSRPDSGAPVTLGRRLTAGERVDLRLSALKLADLPPGVHAVVATVTVTGTSAGGYLKAYAAGQPAPETSVTNWYRTGQTVATTTFIRLNADGVFSVWAAQPTHVLVDLLGVIL